MTAVKALISRLRSQSIKSGTKLGEKLGALNQNFSFAGGE
jgi:hypothetical protein